MVGLLGFSGYSLVVAQLVFFRAGRLALLATDAGRCVVQQCLAHGDSLLAAAALGSDKCKKTNERFRSNTLSCRRRCLFCAQKYPGPGNLPPGPGWGCSFSRRGPPGWRSRGWFSAGSAEFRRISSQMALTLSRCRGISATTARTREQPDLLLQALDISNQHLDLVGSQVLCDPGMLRLLSNVFRNLIIRGLLDFITHQRGDLGRWLPHGVSTVACRAFRFVKGGAVVRRPRQAGNENE